MKNKRKERKMICYLLVFYFLVGVIPQTIYAIPTENVSDPEIPILVSGLEQRNNVEENSLLQQGLVEENSDFIEDNQSEQENSIFSEDASSEEEQILGEDIQYAEHEMLNAEAEDYTENEAEELPILEAEQLNSIEDFYYTASAIAGENMEDNEKTCIVLTGSAFANDRFSREPFNEGVFNNEYGTYLLAQSGDLADRYSTYTVYIPKSGWYYVGARMKTMANNIEQTNYYRYRTMQVSFTQNGQERFVEGENPWSEENLYNFDSYEENGINKYLFGSMRSYVSDLKSYNYTDAKPVYLEAGQADVTIYGNSYARMDFLVISNAPMEDVETKAEYEALYAGYENKGALSFTEDETWIADEWLNFAAAPNECIEYEIYCKPAGQIYKPFIKTTDTGFDLEYLNFTEPVTLKIIARDLYNQTAESQEFDYFPILDNINILISGNAEFTTKCAYSNNIPAFAPQTDSLSGDAFNLTTNQYLVLNPGTSEPLKHTTRIFVPKSGFYYVHSRAMANWNEMRWDPKYGAFTISFEQYGQEYFVEGENPITDDDSLQEMEDFDSYVSDGINKYLFGAMRKGVSDYKGYMYTDAQPIYLQQGFADLNIYGYQRSAFDYIAITEKQPYRTLTPVQFEYMLGATEFCGISWYGTTVEYTVGEGGIYTFTFPNVGNGGAIFGLTSNGEYMPQGFSNEPESNIQVYGLGSSSYKTAVAVAFDNFGNFVEQRIPLPDTKTTIILTPENNFTVDELDKKLFPEGIWQLEEPDWYGTSENRGIFNQTDNTYIWRTKDAVGTGPYGEYPYSMAVKMYVDVYIPHSGEYKISARAGSSNLTAGGLAANYERIFGISVTQGNNVQPVDSTVSRFELEFYRSTDHYSAYFYPFGMNRYFVDAPEIQYYNYDESSFIYLEEGTATLTFYGFAHTRLDYVAITDYDLELPETKTEYIETIGQFENVNMPYLEDYQIIKNEDGSYDITVKAGDAYGSEIIRSEIYACKGAEKEKIAESNNEIVTCVLEESNQNFEYLIRIENEHGAWREKYLNFAGYNDAEIIYSDNKKAEGHFEYSYDTDTYVFTTTIFPVKYEIDFQYNTNAPTRLDLYEVEESGLQLVDTIYTSNKIILQTEQSIVPRIYCIKVQCGLETCDYSLRVKQISDSSTGILTKQALPEERLFVSVTANNMATLKDAVITIEYDPYQLKLINAVVQDPLHVFTSGKYGDIQVLEEDFGKVRLKYLGDNAPIDYQWSGILNLLEFESLIYGAVNLRCNYE